VQVPLYYTSDTQVSALLPSGTAVGAATITVAYNNQTSASASFTVAANNLGIFTEGQNGQGAAIVTYPDYSLVSAVPGVGALGAGGPGSFGGAANPGDTLTLWSTGLGPVSGNEISGAGLGVNMASIPLTIWVGGVQASIVYQGRSGCCVGEDQIAFTVPANAPTGCAVPLQAQIGSLVSNGTFLAIANGSRSCTPSNPALSGSIVQGLSTGASPPTFGEILLHRQLAASNAGGLQYQDIGQGSFASAIIPATYQSLLPSYFDTIPLGTCITTNSLNPSSLFPFETFTGVDAGKITVSGPTGGAIALTEKFSSTQATQYSALLSSTGTYFSGGNYTVSGAGGNDIGSFSAKFAITAAPIWTSANQFQFSNSGITRASGFTITWTGGSANYYLEIEGRAATDGTGTVGAGFTCLVPSASGAFTVPANVVLALPATVFGELDFKPTLNPIAFTASGLTLGVVTMNYETSVFPAFK
jgi:uncharacterized protein (TIGR03437 family)